MAGSASHSSARISAYNADFVGKCLNSNPSEIEAAAATLLVVVPAKPLRAKHRLAAPRISCRRRSLVMRRVDIRHVSNHSPTKMSRSLLQRTNKRTLNRLESEGTAKAVDDEGGVAVREHPLQIGAVDLDVGKTRPGRDVSKRGRKGLDLGHGRH